MRHLMKLFLVAMLVLLSACVATGGSRADQTLIIKETDKNYFLAVPVSKLAMAIPKGGWSQSKEGGSSSPRYFYFKDKSIILSGWFESDDGFKGVQQFWEAETKAWKQNGLPDARNVSFEKLGNWQVIIYDVDLDKTSKISNSHVRAHWVQSGTWIDLHLSITSTQSTKENRTKLKTLLSGIIVSELSGG